MISQSDLIMIGLAFLIGYIDDASGPKLYHYQDTKVNVYKKYQCPKHCAVDHPHFVYYNSDTDGMIIDKNQLGEKFKEKKVHRKK